MLGQAFALLLHQHDLPQALQHRQHFAHQVCSGSPR